MNGLQEEFGDQVDFINLNVDYAETAAARSQFGFNDRSQYVLTDSAGTIVERWIGPLQQETVAQAIRDYLASRG